ncbi:DNA ligase D [Acuticoccus sp.]|uniref:DNA ligase D n=1 Tax=Acuticoccus sp. TaxID=1904378 RepID=UPI003B52CF19
MADKLERYRAKRDFKLTPEPPPGEAAPSKGVLAYVIQKHDATRLHYDLRLEADGVLKSWAVTRGPSLDPSDKRLAVETEDHPLDYGAFEGTIPKGEYGGGTVMLWDRGTWAMADGKSAEEGFAKGSLSFDLFGERLTGRWHLQRLKPQKNRPPNWLLIKSRDEAADEDGRPVTERHTKSVATGRTMAAIAKGEAVWHSGRPADDQPEAGLDRSAVRQRGSVPAFVAPALCSSRTAPPRGEGWLAEVKYDGYRALLRAADGAATIVTRSEKDWTHRFPAIAEAAGTWRDRGVMLDGEVVVFDAEGRTRFDALQKAFRAAGAVRATYVAFDLLFDEGEDLRKHPIETRKERLAALVQTHPGGTITYGDHVGAGKQQALYERAVALGLEGIVAKRAGSPYRSGRQDAWVKVRAVRTARFVVGGYTEGGSGGLGALVLGAHDGDGRLVPVGRVGTGWSGPEANRLLGLLTPLRCKSRPFARKVEGREVRFVEPALVVDVAYLAMTDDGQLRHGVYKGVAEADAGAILLPSDHPSTAVDRSPAGGMSPGGPARTEAVMDQDPLYGVSLSNPDRVLFPEQNVTKVMLAQHYARHMDRMLPHIAGRPLTLVRCPQGRAKACFYQRHPESLPAALARDIGEEDGAAIVVHEPGHVIELVQKGVLEIHLRGSRADRPDRPDRLVFDLDPGEGVDFEGVKDAAVTLRDRLEALDLASFVKTTGGKGLHVVVPIERRLPWDEAKAWTRAFAESLAKAEPDRFLIVMAKAKRRGRIFIDYLRNDTKSSAVAPYSTRARVGAPFAFPLSWEALAALAEPAPLHVGEAAEGDPWSGLAEVRQRLTASHLRAYGR